MVTRRIQSLSDCGSHIPTIPNTQTSSVNTVITGLSGIPGTFLTFQRFHKDFLGGSHGYNLLFGQSQLSVDASVGHEVFLFLDQRGTVTFGLQGKRVVLRSESEQW